MSKRLVMLTVFAMLALGMTVVASNKKKPFIQAESVVAAGRYLIQIGGCNDCHTPGWDRNPGGIPESEWLTGVAVGFKGPWGTTYAGNLRLFAQKYTVDGFIDYCRTQEFKPFMSSYMMRSYSDEDLTAIYHYLKSLDPKGEMTPDYVPPGQQPQTPVMEIIMPIPEGMEKMEGMEKKE